MSFRIQSLRFLKPFFWILEKIKQLFTNSRNSLHLQEYNETCLAKILEQNITGNLY